MRQANIHPFQRTKNRFSYSFSFVIQVLRAEKPEDRATVACRERHSHSQLQPQSLLQRRPSSSSSVQSVEPHTIIGITPRSAWAITMQRNPCAQPYKGPSHRIKVQEGPRNASVFKPFTGSEQLAWSTEPPPFRAGHCDHRGNSVSPMELTLLGFLAESA